MSLRIIYQIAIPLNKLNKLRVSSNECGLLSLRKLVFNQRNNNFRFKKTEPKSLSTIKQKTLKDLHIKSIFHLFKEPRFTCSVQPTPSD